MKDLRDTIPHPFQPVVEASDTEQIICNTCIKIAKEYLKEGFYRIVFWWLLIIAIFSLAAIYYSSTTISIIVNVMMSLLFCCGSLVVNDDEKSRKIESKEV